MGAGQIPLRVRVGSGPFAMPFFVVTHALIAAQSPGAKVDAAVQVQIRAGAGAGIGAGGLLRRGLITDESGVDAVIPARRINTAKRIATHGNLRYGNRQLQTATVQFDVCVGNQPGQVHASGFQ